jgi:phosphatidylglycerophosphatase A
MRLARWVASGFGSGFAPAAPGTAGSLAGLAIGALLLAASPWALAIAAALSICGGVWAIRASAADGDPGWVVIDEIAGMLIALLPLPRPGGLGLALAFVLFRLLDIAMPGPIGWADRHAGPLAVMGDDVIAGAIVAVVLWALVLLAPQWVT